jgi:cellulose synthase/poly-beta-1,6-N-acetylglucosamine synthase-like glycosyltransferase
VAETVRTSVLLPSLRQPKQLARCLESLARQSVLPGEVIVVWQGEDREIERTAESMRTAPPYTLRMLHSPVEGVVPADNLALRSAAGPIILLIDDDAVAPPNWLAGHLRHHDDANIGAISGPADNFRPDGHPFPKRIAVPVGRVTWFGKCAGNMYDQASEWRNLPPRDVDHLVGFNLSLRVPRSISSKSGCFPTRRCSRRTRACKSKLVATAGGSILQMSWSISRPIWLSPEDVTVIWP